ncbi:YhdP family protein [Atopomonas sediminilitoris]|uniref:YhdP family protein n=1 Tax=Atopomonas sediminilitoris TaxID=2919919 RepID=UPI001F4DD54C|nr:YhdP family protein [Atopomonas sediminilitoris]MCJ8169976.1 TIGR02099 family protein [Atopomonas sediminilitoris]
MSSFLQWLLRVLRVGLTLAAVLVVLLALYVNLGRQYIPLVAEYRDDLELLLSQQLKTPVVIGAVSGHWEGWAPVVRLNDVHFGEGAEQLRFKRLRVMPAVWDSLLSRQPVLAQIGIAELDLTLQEMPDGQWQLTGLTLPKGNGNLDTEALLARMNQLQSLQVFDSRLLIRLRDAEPMQLENISLGLKLSLRRQQLHGRLNLPDGQPLSFSLSTSLKALKLESLAASAYVSLPNSDWSRWVPKRLLGDWQLHEAQFGSELWLDWAAGQPQRVALRLQGDSINLAAPGKSARRVENVQLAADFSRQGLGWRAQITPLTFTLDDEVWSGGAVSAEGDRMDASALIRLQANRVHLNLIARLLRAWAPLPAAADAWVTQLAPSGKLRNVNLDLNLSAQALADKARFSANLESVALKPYKGVPGLAGVSGLVTGNAAGGSLWLESDDFTLFLNTVFAKPWQYHQARARLDWQLDAERLLLSSPRLALRGEEGELNGDLNLHLAWAADAEDWLDLRVGLRDGDALQALKYVPKAPIVSDTLGAWLSSAVKAGAAPQVGFTYQGRINAGGESAARALALSVQVQEAELAFAPDWPTLAQAEGWVRFEHGNTRVAVTQAELAQVAIKDAQAQVLAPAAGQSAVLQLQGQLSGQMAHALRVLQTAPTPAAKALQGWQLFGPLKADLQLALPLAQNAGTAKIKVGLDLQDAKLQLPQPVLTLEAVNGQVVYDSERGISSPTLTGRVLKQPFSAKIEATGAQGDASSIVQARGSLPWQSLALWLGIKQPLPLQGTLPYHLTLALNDQDSFISVQSRLKGMAVQLPAPFGKGADEERDLLFKMSLGGRDRQIWLEYAEQVYARLVQQEGRPLRGQINLGGEHAKLPAQDGLAVSGHLATIDWAQWSPVVERLRAGQDATAAAGANPLRRVQLRVDQLLAGGMQFDQLQLGANAQGAGWAINADSAQAQGELLIQPDKPLDLRIARLDLPAQDPDAPPAQEDPLASVSPEDLPALDFDLKQLNLGGKPVGAISLRVRAVPSGARISELKADLRGLQVGGELDWLGAAGRTQTQFRGTLKSKNLGDVLKNWDYHENLRTESFKLETNLTWPGSPAFLALKRSSGALKLDMRNGAFLEVESGTQALRVFSLLNFSSISRRLKLDFSDLFGKGFAFDRLRGEIAVDTGILTLSKDKPLVVNGTSALLDLYGQIDLPREHVDMQMQVTLPVSNNLALAALMAGAPQIGGVLYIADKLLGDRLSKIASVNYQITGPWQEPEVKFVKPFIDKNKP